MLAAVRVALAQPFTDPVNVGGIPMRRSEARALERALSSKPKLRLPTQAGGAASPLESRQQTFPVSAPLSADNACGRGLPPSGRDAPATFLSPFHTSEVS